MGLGSAGDLEQIFGDQGILQTSLPGYRVRQAQIELAQQIAQTILTGEILVAEAGTGIGKTWAYLVPAMIHADKVLVSTGTRTLQDQLYLKDLPQVRKALGLGGATAILKGRANYVCHYHLKRANEEPGALTSRQQVVWLRQVTQFAATSATGDKSELQTVPEDADIWRLVTSTRENCLGQQECPFISECFLYKARRAAQQSDLVVINHALFMADAALRDEGVSELLPQADLVVFDEAHQLPDVATRFLAQTVSTAQIQDLARQIQVTGLAHAREAVNWEVLCSGLIQACKELRLVSEWMAENSGMRAMQHQFLADGGCLEAAQAVVSSLKGLYKPLETQEQRHPDIAVHLRTAGAYLDLLDAWLSGKQSVASVDPSDQPVQAPAGEMPVAPVVIENGPTEMVSWAELTPAHVRFSSAPLSIAKAFSRERKAHQAWVFLSATLSVKGDFRHFVERLGLKDAETVRLASPFNYPEQALLCVPRGLPAVDHPEFHIEFARYLLPLIQASEGACLILCTTLRAIDRIGDELSRLFEVHGLNWPILRQGHQPRSVLLEQFRAQSRSVLIGSASFREGVDLVGEQLTLVAIDKLPFAPPDDPVLQARMRVCRERRGNPFMELQVPEAAIALKQGAGRLIRSERDWGVLVVGDRRLVDKPYGRQLWQGLPSFRRTQEQKDAIDFIRQRKASALIQRAGPLSTDIATDDPASVSGI